MHQDLVKCPCCERMIPANDVELTFKRPDDIAELGEDAIEERCRYNNDIYILDDQYYYVRAVLPLPVQEKGSDYCLGVWVQLEKEGFDKVYDLWDEEDQTNELPIPCILANKIPFTSSSKNSSALLHLVGAKSRPKVQILNKHCSLFQQQNSGITIHQASEFSDMCR